MLRHQGGVLGPVASAPTVWRPLAEVTPAGLMKIQTALARVRRHVWAQIPASAAIRSFWRRRARRIMAPPQDGRSSAFTLYAERVPAG